MSATRILEEASAVDDGSNDIPPDGARGRRLLNGVVLVVVALAAGYGALERLWLLVHLPLFGDEAVVGLMVRQIDAGEFSTFYWGQKYGGVEPYVAALVGHVVPGPIGLNASASLVALVAALLVGLVVHEISGDWRAGGLAGALAWVWPYAVVWNSSRELGFRFATLVFGLALLYFAVRVCHGHRGPVTLLMLGACAGIGWWSSPEIAYFTLPAGIVLIGSWRRWTDGWSARLNPWPAVLVVIGAVAGALPWLVTNANDGFASLSLSSAPAGGSTYGGRLAVFVEKVLPTALGLRMPLSGQWVGGRVLGHLLYGVSLLILSGLILIACRALRRGRRGLPLFAGAVGIAAFPFVFAANPGAGYWQDGRYGDDFSFLVAVLALSALVEVSTSSCGHKLPTGARDLGADSSPRNHATTRWGVAVGSTAVAVAALLTAIAARDTSGTPVASVTRFFSGWQNPNAAIDQVTRSMDAAGIRFAYGDYWVSYTLDDVDPSLMVSPSPLDPVRSKSIARAVAGARQPAWLFFAPGKEAAAGAAFSNPETGPGNYSESAFVSMLTREGNGYRLIHLGVLDAVVPDRPVSLS